MDVRCMVPVGPGSRVPLDGRLACGRFLRRVNRFVAEVQLGGQIELVHVPNSGRLTQLLIPGNPVILGDRRSPTRKTDREVSVGGSRFDYRLGRDGDPGACWVELKSVTLTVPTPWGPEARFPDAPTRRGTRHLRELSALAGGGTRCAVVFAVCRPDAQSVSAHAEVDPAFASALWDAAMAGVEIYGLRIHSDPRTGCGLEGRLPVRIVRIPSPGGNHF